MNEKSASCYGLMTSAESLVGTSHEHVFGKCCLSLVLKQPDAHCHDIACSCEPTTVIDARFS